MRTLHLLIAATFLASQPANAQSWRHVVRSIGGPEGPSEIYIDTSRYSRTGNRLYYWQRTVFDREQGEGEQRFNELVIYIEAECTELSYRLMQIMLYLNGRHVDSETVEAEPEVAPPGSAGERVLRTACAL